MSNSNQQHSAAAPQAQDFVTTSQIMNTINQALNNDLDDSSDDTPRSYFELQRRLPDGSTRKATASEQAAADCESQIQQAVCQVQKLESWPERAAWAQAQRLHGNDLYRQGRYQQAIHVYLTCLPALEQVGGDKDTDSFLSSNGIRDNKKSKLKLNAKQQEERRLLFLKILNNLAQSALQEQWYGKAEKFCSLALEHLDASNSSTPPMSDDHGEQLCKLYYRRAKAHRLRGDYTLARLDLKHALEFCHSPSQQKVVQREVELLEQNAAQARQNAQEQKAALQRAMKSRSTFMLDGVGNNHATGLRHRHVPNTAVNETRRYSTLRAPRRRPRQQRPLPNSSWQHYWRVMGKVTDKVLEWTDEEHRARRHEKTD